MSDDAKAAFVKEITAGLAGETFVRLTFGKSRDPNVRKCVVTPVRVKNELRLRFVETRGAQDVTAIKDYASGVEEADRLAGSSYLSATLFTFSADISLTYNKRMEPNLTRSRATLSKAPATGHDRAKQYLVPSDRGYLKQLGVSLDDGRVKPSMYPKFKQIAHFIAIMDDILRGSILLAATEMTAIDIGSGKGYLTFALYDYLTSRLGKTVSMTGIELRAKLVEACNAIAVHERFNGLRFEAVAASEIAARPLDLLIALHACDTATDDAIASGIAARAAVIVVAPCCQHELAPQLARHGGGIGGLMKFGLLKQRQADLFTDAARALLLEASGYKVKVIEFVSTEHTSKNLMLAGVRSGDADRAAAARQYADLKAFAGFKTQRLELALARLTVD